MIALFFFFFYLTSSTFESNTKHKSTLDPVDKSTTVWYICKNVVAPPATGVKCGPSKPPRVGL